MIKYAENGLVNDRYYYNMNLSLFKKLFWLINISLFAVNQGNMFSVLIKYEGVTSLFDNTYRLIDSI